MSGHSSRRERDRPDRLTASRSRSPARHHSHRGRYAGEYGRDRETGGHHHRQHDRHEQANRKRDPPTPPSPSTGPLPFDARRLDRQHDYAAYRPVLGLYLEIQKQILIEDIPEKEARGRWKRFVSKWNHGELAEGWYDPAIARKAQQAEQPPPSLSEPISTDLGPQSQHHPVTQMEEADATEDEDDYGPALPPTSETSRRAVYGAGVPSLEDIELRRESEDVERKSARTERKRELRDYRKQEQAKLDELVPKADAGTRERQLEKRREAAAANRAFTAGRTEVGGAVEIGDDDLMGGADGAEEYRRTRKEQERKKNEREIRRDEILRARQAEREARVRAYRQKEENTMAGLIALAKQKYG